MMSAIFSIPADTCMFFSTGRNIPTERDKGGKTHPDEVGRDAGRKLLLVRELLVSRRRGVDDESLRVADVREVAREPEAVNDLAPDLRVAALDAEAEHPAKCGFRAQQAERLLVELVRGQAEVRYPGDLRMLLEPSVRSVRVRV